MANPISVLPDAELALIQYLKAQPLVTALVSGERITTTLPPKPSYPHVTIKRVGGTAVAWQHIDSAALQVDVWGGSRYDCQRIARTIRAAIVAIYNDQVNEAILVSGFEEVGPQWLPDTVTVPPLSRFTARFQVLLHP